MKLSSYSFLCASALLIGLTACSRSSSEVPSQKPFSVLSVSPRTPLVKVNQTILTAGDYQKRYALEQAIWMWSHQTVRVNELEHRRNQFMRSRLTQIMPELINQALIRNYMREKGFTVDEKTALDFLATSLRKLKVKEPLAQFSQKLKVDEFYLRDQLLAPARCASAREVYGKEPFVVTDKEVDEGLARQQKYYDRAIASNAVTYVTASNLLAKIKAGLDFKEAGLRYGAFQKEDAERWERLEASEFTNPALKNWAFTAPLGSVAGPFEMEDGLSLVKILEREKGTLEDSVVSEKVADVTLARITFYMVVPEPEPRTREYVHKRLIQWKEEQAQKALFEELHQKMKISFPSGTNFLFQAEDAPKQELQASPK